MYMVIQDDFQTFSSPIDRVILLNDLKMFFFYCYFTMVISLYICMCISRRRLHDDEAMYNRHICILENAISLSVPRFARARENVGVKVRSRRIQHGLRRRLSSARRRKHRRLDIRAALSVSVGGRAMFIADTCRLSNGAPRLVN